MGWVGTTSMPHKYAFTAEGYHNARQHYLRTGNFVPYSLGYIKEKNMPVKRPRETQRAAPYKKHASGRGAHSAQLTDAEMNWAYDQGMKKASSMALQRSAKFGNELRGIDTAINVSPVIDTFTTNGSAFMLNGTSIGSGSFNRIGNKIAMQSLRLRGRIKNAFAPAATTAGMVAQTVRMVVLYDKMPSGVLPNWNVIFGSINNEGTSASGLLDSLLLTRTKRFRVLKDCVYTFSPQIFVSGGSTNPSQQDVVFDEFIPLKGLETQYTASNTTPVIGDISSGGLYVYFRASDNDATCAAGVETAVARLRFQP